MKFLEALKTRWVIWIWSHTPTCAEMARLVSLTLDEPVSPKVRLKMWLHYLICVWCERYYKHLKFLRRAGPQFSEEFEAASDRKLPVEIKRRIINRLQEEWRH